VNETGHSTADALTVVRHGVWRVTDGRIMSLTVYADTDTLQKALQPDATSR